MKIIIHKTIKQIPKVQQPFPKSNTFLPLHFCNYKYQSYEDSNTIIKKIYIHITK